jgi:hypothetical protein
MNQHENNALELFNKMTADGTRKKIHDAVSTWVTDSIGKTIAEYPPINRRAFETIREAVEKKYDFKRMKFIQSSPIKLFIGTFEHNGTKIRITMTRENDCLDVSAGPLEAKK